MVCSFKMIEKSIIYFDITKNLATDKCKVSGYDCAEEFEGQIITC